MIGDCNWCKALEEIYEIIIKYELDIDNVITDLSFVWDCECVESGDDHDQDKHEIIFIEDIDSDESDNE